MTHGRGSQLAETRPVGVRLDLLRGEPMPTAGPPVTPVARRLALWWPGGAWVYAWPVAVEYPDGQRTQRVRIVHVRMVSLATFAALGLAAVALFVARRPRQRRGSPTRLPFLSPSRIASQAERRVAL
jgi:hypothetical protein